jgi:hypothetical protein
MKRFKALPANYRQHTQGGDWSAHHQPNDVFNSSPASKIADK